MLKPPMRSHSLKLVTVALLLLATSVSMFGQPTNVVDWNHTWKYDQSGALPDPNWFAINYDDSAWPSGSGALGFPTGENLLGQVGVNTPLSMNPPGGGAQIITYYFRTTFVLPTTNGIT